jgi:hypothetical protein
MLRDVNNAASGNQVYDRRQGGIYPFLMGLSRIKFKKL